MSSVYLARNWRVRPWSRRGPLAAPEQTCWNEVSTKRTGFELGHVIHEMHDKSINQSYSRALLSRWEKKHSCGTKTQMREKNLHFCTETGTRIPFRRTHEAPVHLGPTQARDPELNKPDQRKRNHWNPRVIQTKQEINNRISKNVFSFPFSGFPTPIDSQAFVGYRKYFDQERSEYKSPSQCDFYMSS